MNIICSFDNKYSPYAGVMLASLFENNKDIAITVYALTDYVDNANHQKFLKLAKDYNQHIVFVNVDNDKFRNLPYGGSKFKHIGLSTYYRLLSDVLLPDEVNKVLYLDCDIIVNASLKEFYDTDISKVAVYALYDKPDVSTDYSDRLGYNKLDGYINSGVLLINLAYWRKMNFSDLAFKFLRSHIDKIVYHDQDVLNALLHDKKSVFPLKYNMMECFFMKQPSLHKIYVDQLQNALLHPVIIHFTGTRKPWHIECNHPYRYLYLMYLAMTPWKDCPLIHRYNTVSEKVKYRLKVLVKWLLNLFGNGKYTYIKL